jgi:hypothetical protein
MPSKDDVMACLSIVAGDISLFLLNQPQSVSAILHQQIQKNNPLITRRVKFGVFNQRSAVVSCDALNEVAHRVMPGANLSAGYQDCQAQQN